MLIVEIYWYQERNPHEDAQKWPFKTHSARVYQHLKVVAHSMLNDDARVARTAALVVRNSNVALGPFPRLLHSSELIDSMVWVLRFLYTLVFGLATVCCNIAISCPRVLSFFHVNNITNAQIFQADNDFFYRYLQVCDLIISRRTVYKRS